jgi:hypothetical protein
MERVRIAITYTDNFIEIDRPQPLSDNKIERLIQDVLAGKLETDISDTVSVSYTHLTLPTSP